MTRRKMLKIAALALCVVLAQFTLIVMLVPVLRDEHTYPMSVGNHIVLAIETYKAREGAYPADLQSLVPKDIPVIPRPDFGVNRWEYRLVSLSQSYELKVRFQENNYPCLYYYGASQEWAVDQ